MVLSEAEALARLEDLRRERDTIERQIADLLLYLDLGRRLGGSKASDTVPGPASPPSCPATPDRAGPLPEPAPRAVPLPEPVVERPSASEPPAPLPAAGTEMEAGVSETVMARRYGRAVIEAALAVLEEAGRPLHASEILVRLVERGFTLPGQDPVAALNTRLWKRSGPGGPLKRLGEAVYAPSDAEEG